MIQYTQINLIERIAIYDGIKKGLSSSNIAKGIGRNKSTITREIERNRDFIGYLFPRDAQAKTAQRKARHGPKVNRNPLLMNYVVEKLKLRWSPSAIAGRWTLENPKGSITAEAIYSFIYHEQNKSLELWRYLPHKKQKRALVRKKQAKSKIPNRVTIQERPEHIEKRNVVGHFEADLFLTRAVCRQMCLTLLRERRA
jgi:transposase, IS30 family